MDPLFVKWASAAFAVLLGFAARHKFASLPVFQAILRDYRVLPAALLAPAAWAIASLELLIAVAWVATWIGALPAIAPAVATAALLATYTAAIVVNLLRGRRHVSCGCGLSGSDGDHLSWNLVLRNATLLALALAAALPASERAIGAADYAVLASALLASVLLYIAASQLWQNAAAFSARSQRRD